MLTLDRNTGFAGGVAAALDVVRSDYVALLNNDAAADPRWLEVSAALLDSKLDTAAVTSRLVLWDADREGRAILNNAGVALVAGGYGTDRGFGQPDGPPFDQRQEVFGFSGGACLLRRSAVEAIGGIAPEFFMYYEDADLSWRMRLAGYTIRYEPAATVRHRHGASSDLRSESFAYFTERNRLLMLLRCAPFGFAIRQVGRFVVTTLSLAAPAPDEAADPGRGGISTARATARIARSSSHGPLGDPDPARDRHAPDSAKEHSHRNLARTSDARLTN